MREYASNATLTGRAAILIATHSCCVVTAGFNGRGRALLYSWRQISDWVFRSSTAGRAKFAVDYGWADERYIDWLPVLGELVFPLHAPTINPTYGCRTKQHTGDPNVIVRNVRAEINSADSAGQAELAAARRGRSEQRRNSRANSNGVAYSLPRGRPASRNTDPRRMIPNGRLVGRMDLK